jgi:hypothetical protein
MHVQRMLIVNMSQRRHAKVNKIYINRENGLFQETTMQQEINAGKQQQHKIWDLGGLQKLRTHDQNIMNIFNLGSLMQDHFTFKINLFDWT